MSSSFHPVLRTARRRLAEVLFAADPIDSFLDANRPKDLAEVERLARDAVAVPERAAKAAGSGE